MTKQTEQQNPTATKEESDSKNNNPPNPLEEEELEGVAGGRTSIFADVPRVPSWDYNNEIKNKI